jgi:hypothetical protein
LFSFPFHDNPDTLEVRNGSFRQTTLEVTTAHIMFPCLGGATLPNGAPAAEPLPAEDGTKLIDLSEKLDKPSCYARNENAGYPWGNLFIGDSRLGMQSDADEQLIIHLSFQEFVKVCSRINFVRPAFLPSNSAHGLTVIIRPQ